MAALDISRDPERMSAAMTDFMKDIHANNAIGPLISYANTWKRFHDAAFNKECDMFNNEKKIDVFDARYVDMLPLTHEKIWTVASLFEAGHALHLHLH